MPKERKQVVIRRRIEVAGICINAKENGVDWHPIATALGYGVQQVSGWINDHKKGNYENLTSAQLDLKALPVKPHKPDPAQTSIDGDKALESNHDDHETYQKALDRYHEDSKIYQAAIARAEARDAALYEVVAEINARAATEGQLLQFALTGIQNLLSNLIDKAASTATDTELARDLLERINGQMDPKPLLEMLGGIEVKVEGVKNGIALLMQRDGAELSDDELVDAIKKANDRDGT